MGLSCGIVGLPNVGKSTLFNALTRGHAPASNYPFCTIEPNVGIVSVPDPRLAKIAELAPRERVVPANIRFVDIAGLVQGASQGAGLGNQFLGHIAEVDAIVHVVRCFDDSAVAHVTGSIDPPRDMEIVQTELLLKDLSVLTGAAERLEKPAKTGDKQAAEALGAYRPILKALNEGRPAREAATGLSTENRDRLKGLNLLSAKPVLYVANVAEKDFPSESPWLQAVREVAARQGAPVVPMVASLEAQIAELEEAEQAEFLQAMGLEEPGLNRLIRAAYELLGLNTFFTAVGAKELRAWTIPKGTRAPAAAGAVHSDMERGFIRAEVMSYDDFVACGSEAAARDRGRLRLEGKDYVVQDGDLIHFRFSV